LYTQNGDLGRSTRSDRTFRWEVAAIRP